jgi:hypothetical protein
MEYQRIYLHYDGTLEVGTMVFPADGAETKKADEKIAAALRDGWSIASTTPVTMCNAKFGSYTHGIEVFLTRG